MRIAVMAAGGLGGYYGGLLARQGHRVFFIARGAHLGALRANGLTIKSTAGDFQIKPVEASDNPGEVGPVDWVLFAVKAYDNAAAIKAMRPLVGDQTVVITLENGVTSHEELGAAFGNERILVAPTQIVSNIVSPGVIAHASPFRTMLVGEVGGKEITPRVAEIAAEFTKGGVDVTAVPDGLVPLWDKFVFLSSVAGVTTLARTEPHLLLRHPEAAEVYRAALEEAYAVARACDVALPGDTVDRWYRFAMGFKSGTKASMQLDLERGKRLEIDALSGAVVRLGVEKGIPTPVHKTIYAALKREDERAQANLVSH
jgi:2-dehydropantoate 2-reductase